MAREDELEEQQEEQMEEEAQEEEDSSLASALTGEFKSAPWYMASLAIHGLIFLLLMLIPYEPPREKEKTIVITTSLPEEEEKEEEPVTDIVEVDPVVTTDNPVNEPAPIIVTSDFEVSDHNETDNDMDNNTAQGDPECVTTFDGDVNGTPLLMGVGNKGGTGGGGRFGTRLGGGKRNLVARGGGSRKTESAVDWALRWLAEHQEENGQWDNKKYGGGGHDAQDEAISALAILAFLGAGNTPKFGKYKNTVAKGLYWLKQRENPAGSGCFGQHRYEAGICLMALAEAYGMTNDPELRALAQRAVDWAVKAQCPSGGWDYAPASPRVDTSVTGWWVMGLKSAKMAGLNVPYDVFEKALKYIQKATGARGDGPYGGATVSYATENAPTVEQVTTGGGSTRMTAVALTSLQFLGRPRDDPQVVGCANQVVQDGVPTTGSYDFYRWYYAALGLFQMGVKSEYWKKWNEPMKNALLELQVKEGTFKENKGSWNYEREESPGSTSWGRVGQTAIGALMLEVYYRYDDCHRNPVVKK